MKVNLLTGKDKILTPPPPKNRKVIPEKVETIALKHWTNTTIPEPSVHRRMKRREKKRKENGGSEEIVPTRWQHLSQREQYANFKEDCGEEISEVMRKHAEDGIRKLQNRPDSEDKDKRLDLYRNMHDKFPSESWYLDQKPPEVKPLCDHTTGLCRVCEAAGLNFITLSQSLKRLCVCRTDQCPNWICFCGEDNQERCSCLCACEACK